jgi:hypothetical protein
MGAAQQFDWSGLPKAAGVDLEQLDGYLARLGQDLGWFLIFDRRENARELEER